VAVCIAEITLAAKTPEGLRIAAVFKELRESAGLTQEQAAERAGLTLAGYRPYEQGKRQMRTEQIGVFAEAFSVSRSTLAERLGVSFDPAAIALEDRIYRTLGPERAHIAGRIFDTVVDLPPDLQDKALEMMRVSVMGVRADADLRKITP